MEGEPSSGITQQLKAWTCGDSGALDRVMELLAYPELRNIAQRYMSGTARTYHHGATELVHEAYLQLVDIRQVQ